MWMLKQEVFQMTNKFKEIVYYWVVNYYGISDSYTVLRIKDDLAIAGLLEDRDYKHKDIIKTLEEGLAV
jgi:hypothetical protein